MGGQHGINEIAVALELLVEIGNVSEQMVKAKKEGGNTLQVLAKLVSLGDELFALIGVDFKEMVAELKEIDSEDMDDLRAHFKTKFDLENDELEGVIEQGIDLLDSLGDSVEETVKFVKKVLKK